MEETLEIYFCEICNESVPAKDLPTREAIQAAQSLCQEPQDY